MSKFSDRQFLDAVESTTPERGQIQKIAQRVGCAEGTTIKRLRKLEEAGCVQVTKHTTYDRQEFRPGNWLFGGGGSCVRRYLCVRIIHLTKNGH